MPSSKERIDELEKRLKAIEQEKAIAKEVERAINNQKSGLFKYLMEMIRILMAIAILTTVGDEALDKYPWITDLIK
jgi:phage regulator Rha-like protein